VERPVDDAAARVHQVARRYLIDHVGNLAVAGVPVYDGETETWTVSISCATDRGVLPVGKVVLDNDARVASVPSREELNEIAERLYRRTPVLVYAEKETLEAAGFEVVSR
jgi:hypothetical protein